MIAAFFRHGFDGALRLAVKMLVGVYILQSRTVSSEIEGMVNVQVADGSMARLPREHLWSSVEENCKAQSGHDSRVTLSHRLSRGLNSLIGAHM